MPAQTDGPPLTRIEGVELARVGSWGTMLGRWDAKADDFTAAIEAANCPATRPPLLKLGHLDQRFTPHAQMPTFDGTPSIGWVDNMRIEGDVLLGDFAGVPQWLRTVAASAFPNRSVEAAYNRRCALGHTHPFSIGAVALLGVTPPGVDSLRSLHDIPALFGLGIAAAGCADIDIGEVIVATIGDTTTADPAEPVHTGAMVALIPAAEDAARLAVDGGEPADQLHCTLMYLGDAADIPAMVRQDAIDAVSTAANGLPEVVAEAFALSIFNPPGATSDDGRQRDPCITLGLSGDPIDAVHTLIAESVLYTSPQQHAPWHAHITLVMGGGFDQLATLADRIGPVRFDRIRIAFGGENIDIPLIAEDDAFAGDQPEDPSWAADGYVAAAGGPPVGWKKYWLLNPEGLKKWATKKHPWTALFRHLRKHMDPEMAKRVTSDWYREHFGHMPNQKAKSDKVAASDPLDDGGDLPAGITVVRNDTGEPEPIQPPPAASEPTTPPQPGGVSVPQTPGAEPEQHESEPTKGEDPVSTLSTDVRSRLGLADDADDAAVVAALDALKTRADTPTAAPDPQAVAAAAAATQENEELRKEVQVLASQMTTVTTELAAAKAAQAATTKATVIGEARRLGKFTPADEEKWSTDYDEAPGAVTRVLASIAPGTAVPVAASGHAGTGEDPVGDDWDAIVARIDGPYAQKEA